MATDPLYARYPFFEAAREAVAAADASLAELAAERAPAVERGAERVERALMEGTVAPEPPGAWSARDELLSYPVARVLVSLVDAPAVVEKYAAAEAATAGERFVADFDGGGPGREDRVTLGRVLSEFDLDGVVRPEPPGAAGGPGPAGGGAGRQGRAGAADRRGSGAPGTGRQRPGDRAATAEAAWFRVGVATYLRLAGDWGPEWRLVARELADGEVRVERQELYRLLREAVRRRVAEGLPFDVREAPGGDRIVEALAPETEALRALLSDRESVGEIDTVAPDLFPPCMSRLVERARRGADLPPHASFALMAFLVGIGMAADEIVAFCEGTALDPEAIRYQTEYLRDDRGSQYPPPSCETLHAYGLCENAEDHWEVAGHPLVYYERQLAEAGEVSDWRDRSDAASEASG